MNNNDFIDTLKDENGAWNNYNLPVPVIENTDFGSIHKWYKHGVLHRENDLPAVVHISLEHLESTGEYIYQAWLIDGKAHRDGDKPAIIDGYDDSRTWYQHDKIHRDNDLPAYIKEGGIEVWYQNDERHRDNDLPALVSPHQTVWFKHGVPHRDYMPALFLRSGDYEYGKIIRVEEESCKWVINGENKTDEIEEAISNGTFSEDYENWNDKEKAKFKLMFH